MSRALIITLCLNMATAAVYEWKGVFHTPEKTYKWGAEKVSGKYADPAMKLAAIPVTAATEAALTGAESKGTAALGTQCVDVTKGGTITPAEGKCYKLTFDAQSSKTVFNVDATNVNNIAFFAEHLPTEFEATEHYFKDTTGVDIEPQAQAPKPSGDGHSHGHGGTDNFEGKCVCQAQANNWKLDCSNKAKVQAAVTNLDAKVACKATGPPKDCIDNYYVMQAHHDHCLHNQLPTGVELTLHAYEQYYTDCFVKRQFSAALSQCPTVDCNNAQAMTAAIATLKGCGSAQLCASTACSAAIKTILMAHDTCPENKLPNSLETALHNYEGHCAAQLCNTASAAFDPYDDKCSANVVSGGFGSRDTLLVTTSVLPLAVLLFL